MDALTTLWATSASIIATRLVFHPLDTLRTLQQTSNTKELPKIPLHRYYRGLTASIFLNIPAYATYLYIYKTVRSELAPVLGEKTIPTYFAAGATAEIFSSFLYNPMEVIKGRLQIMNLNSEKSLGTMSVVKLIYNESGLKGFYRGYWMGLVVFMPHTIVWWVGYEEAKRLLQQGQEKTNRQIIAASSIATTAACTVSNFLDVVKTRQQLANSQEVLLMRPDDRLGVWKVITNLIKEQGVFWSIFKGLGSRLSYNVPATALGLTIVEYIDPKL
ncbi:hypothetical protein CANCADRAFT_78 [Tortispora caseinolytica NRRL Y-17796]|uniref:Mitochondrial carrier n=1 Tax=Tortispora caseinolytica NRRL Y-17796 TaxID=767744 RepID=A0A1E4TIC8_9ASCO|nr:hypothetical protein CANCADRAFT_78 [Tortispora caseinolytica NRRL Y-17796]